MKKQIGLLALIGLLVSFMAFSGVASAQTSNAQVVLFTSPMCSVCQAVEPRVQSAAAQYGVTLIIYDVTTTEGRSIAQANGVSGTPTIVISGAQPATFTGDVSQQQIATAIKAAIGTATPTKAVVKAVATATPAATVKAVATVKKTTTVKQALTTTTAKATTQPAIEVVTATQTPATSTKTVPEFSLLGLGAPALAVGAIYLFLRRR
jgi:thioredoxin-like negative regulator of GroEL